MNQQQIASGISPTPLFQRPWWVVAFALTSAIAWGWAFPLVKLGFAEFAITPDMTAAKLLFAGLRFTLAGLVVLLIAKATRRNFQVARPIDWSYVAAFALVNTTLHYAFFYFGMSHSAGSRAAILNSMSSFLIVLLACLFFKSDRMTWRKALGCCIGISGIVLLQTGNNTSGQFTFLGDGMIMINTLCAAVAGLMTRGLSRRMDIFVGTGYSLTLGGALLLAAGGTMGGHLPTVTLQGVVILSLLISITTIGFMLYNKLLSCNPVGKIAIFNSLIPIVGTLTSCLCLNEPFHVEYLWAALLASSGIYLINRNPKA